MLRPVKVLFIFLGITVSIDIYGQQDSCSLQISLLTCGPGKELYSTFGHTGIRVTDPTKNMDVVFNYGTFDDSDPYFYLKFTRGIMLYALSVQYFSDFLQEYQIDERSVISQTLYLSCAAKQKLFDSLRINALEENRYYNYYFHTDNCTTRARDILEKKAGAQVAYKDILPATKPTFRQLIHSYLDKGGQQWSKFGIDFFLGSNVDKLVTTRQSMFLPDYLMKGLDSATITGDPLVGARETILESTTGSANKPWFTPIVFFTGLLIVALILTFSPGPWARDILSYFDSVFFLLVALLGILLLLLWVIRIDTVCRNNINLLWALPTHALIPFALSKRKSWIKKYLWCATIIDILLLITWFWLPQQLNTAFAPIIAIIVIRSWHLTSRFKKV